MPYSAVTQPRPVLRRNAGTPSSMDAVQSTRVSPNSISTEPSACRVKRRVMHTGRSSSGARPLGLAFMDGESTRASAERRGGLYGAPAQGFEPGSQLLIVFLEEPRDVAIAQIRPDAVGAQKQQIARLQHVPAAHSHLGNRRIAAEAALDEIAHRVRRQFFLGDLAFAQQQLDVAVVAGPLEDFA